MNLQLHVRRVYIAQDGIKMNARVVTEKSNCRYKRSTFMKVYVMVYTGIYILLYSSLSIYP